MNAIRISMLSVLALFAAGCTVDIQPTLPPVAMQFQYPLPPLLPIATDMLLPSIDLCATASEEAINETLATIPFGNVLADWITIERVEIVEAVMEGTEPQGSSFQGFTEVSFLESGRVILTATPGNGIEGNRVTLTSDEAINLWEAIQACPEDPSELTVRVRGIMPLNAPTRWETRITVHLVARVSPF